MKFKKVQTYIRLFTDLKFAIFVLFLIVFASSLGSIIEQDEPISFYEEKYPSVHPIYGFVDSKFILQLGLDHVYTVWWFLLLLIILGICLICCTITRQFPTFVNSKKFFFQKEKKSFQPFPFFVQMKVMGYTKELMIAKIQNLNYYTYQKGKFLYAYKGLLGRISPILVHFSLILLLVGSGVGAFQNMKAQEVITKGELFHIQNPIRIGFLTSLPTLTIRVNDFWVEYQNNRIHQFYSNLSVLSSTGQEMIQKTISVNNPLRSNQLDFYQSDWNLIGIRVLSSSQEPEQKIITQYPLFSLQKNPKSWITWINSFDQKETNLQNRIIVFDQFQNVFFLYDQNGTFLKVQNLNEEWDSNKKIIDILSSTGLLIKYDPTIGVIYFGFGLLMLTTFVSYLSFTQIWIYKINSNLCYIGCMTNRGKINIEIEFENILRRTEKTLKQLKGIQKI